MSDHSTGLLLKKNFPHWHTIIILDIQFGKIVAIPENRDANKLCVGALITYYITPQQQNYRISNCEIIDVPLALGRHEIMFLHQVFELLYYFIQLNSGPTDTFALIQLLFNNNAPELLKSSLAKKIFFLKLFITLGLQPEHSRFNTPHFHQLTIQSIDTLLRSNLKLINEHELDQWLLQCIQAHPCTNYFKAIQLLPRTP